MSIILHVLAHRKVDAGVLEQVVERVEHVGTSQFSNCRSRFASVVNVAICHHPMKRILLRDRVEMLVHEAVNTAGLE
jgi:hypothetical protein